MPSRLKKRKTENLRNTFKRLKLIQGYRRMSHTPPVEIATLTSTNNTQNNGGHQETQLDPIQYRNLLQPGPPDYTHVYLPFMYERQYRFDQATNFSMMDFGIRMTSVYDPIRDDASPSDINPGSGVRTIRPILTESETLTGTGYVDWYDWYASQYKYYSVLECEYKICIENLSNEKFFVHKMFTNNIAPNVKASNLDILRWRSAESRLLTPIIRFANSTRIYNTESNAMNVENDDMNGAGTTNASGTIAGFASNPIGRPIHYFEGTYYPGEYNREVINDNDVSIYTAIGSNPTLPEILLLRIKPYDNASPIDAGDSNNYDRSLTFNITIQCTYKVEFKELVEGLYRPASRNPAYVVLNSETRD